MWKKILKCEVRCLQFMYLVYPLSFLVIVCNQYNYTVWEIYHIIKTLFFNILVPKPYNTTLSPSETNTEWQEL